MHVRLQMRALTFVVFAQLAVASAAYAQEPRFTGKWEIDVRSSEARAAGVECGSAGFRLRQSGVNIVGDHWMATSGCGRLNEGGEGSVTGVVRGRSAVLTVTSGRNGQVVRGQASLEGPNLRWIVLKELEPGSPSGEGLILHQGLLRRVGG